MKVQATIPMPGVVPSTVITFDKNGPVWLGDEKIGHFVRIAEVRNDEVVVTLEVDDKHADAIAGRRGTFCGITIEAAE
jgi:hypothetical protein